jgi:acetyl-CoA carboxylase carboxyltransferase component
MSHASRSGVAHFVADDEDACIEDVRYLLSFLPQNNAEDPPRGPAESDPQRPLPELDAFLPDSAQQAYDMKELVAYIVDDGEFFEVQPYYAQNIVIGFARIDGYVVGVVGNQPQVLAGTLDIHASEKAARFVRTCDAFNIPLVTFVDVPGFLPGTDQEYGGIIRHGAKLLYAYCEATVPRVQVIVRKSYGGAYVVMNARSIGCDYSVAWPTAEIAVMGASGAVNIIGRREIMAADDPERRRQELIVDYTDRYCTPYIAAERGMIDEVILPSETRARLISALSVLSTKRQRRPHRKHGNIPL